MAHDFMAVKSYSGHEIMGDNRFLLAAAGGASTNPDSLSTTFTTLHASHPPPTHPPTRRAREGGRPNFLVVGGGWVGAAAAFPPRQLALPVGAEQPPLHASAAEDLARPGSARRRQAADDNLLSIACRTDAAPNRAPTAHVLIPIARERGVQPLAHRRGHESCSPAAKCMRARARNARCSPSLR